MTDSKYSYLLKSYLKPLIVFPPLVIFIGLTLAYTHFVATPKTHGHILPADYESWSGEDKQNYLWKQIILNPYDVNNLPRIKLPPLKDVLGLFSKSFLKKTFTYTSDIMPPDRMKAIHWLGTIAKADFVSVGDHPYTGLLQGSKIMVRASLAAPIAGFTPGMGMKWFVDGKASVNLAVLFSFEGQGESRNFFEKTLSHRVPAPVSAVIQKLAFAFKKVKRNPFQLEPHFLAQVNSQGRTVKDIKSPYQIDFVPNPNVQSRFNSKSKIDFRKQFSDNLKAGDVIYNVYAVEAEGMKPLLIGKIVLTSEFVASQFGDEEFFIQHHMDDKEMYE